MARLQLAELTAFIAVAEHLSFTKAAVQTGVALPTMSQTIRSLEDRLGVRLFNRTTRSVALTEAGERLLAEIQDGSFAKKFMEENRTGRHQFEKYRTTERGQLIEKVGSQLRAAMPFLDPVTAESQSPAKQEATTTA